eukprot:TRINITY_DN13750_c0_g1_i7.p1 TRINITY_DN13750_c0_g1~~TRINITY_DN13750_c0_g1_i7.p1  ORF type:complete len:483 (+),score=81.68 TRINITY_DN13750_c0_g1_i7:102-1550(+)
MSAQSPDQPEAVGSASPQSASPQPQSSQSEAISSSSSSSESTITQVSQSHQTDSTSSPASSPEYASVEFPQPHSSAPVSFVSSPDATNSDISPSHSPDSGSTDLPFSTTPSAATLATAGLDTSASFTSSSEARSFSAPDSKEFMENVESVAATAGAASAWFWSNPFLDLVGVGFLLVAVLLLIFWLLRRHISSVTVSCWFCHHHFDIKRRHQPFWKCPQCQQYNGFDDRTNTGYKKDIPELRDPSLNPKRFRVDYLAPPVKVLPPFPPPPFVLCRDCQYNQERLVDALAQIDFPSSSASDSDSDSDSDVAHYHQRVTDTDRVPASTSTQRQVSQILHSVFKLCAACEAGVSQELAENQRKFRVPTAPPLLRHKYAGAVSARVRHAYSRYVPRWLPRWLFLMICMHLTLPFALVYTSWTVSVLVVAFWEALLMFERQSFSPEHLIPSLVLFAASIFNPSFSWMTLASLLLLALPSWQMYQKSK